MNDPAPEDEPAALDYAPRPRRGRRRLTRWTIGALLIVLVGTGFHFRQPVADRVRLLYWQRQCLTYARPAGTIAYTIDSLNPAFVANVRGDGDFSSAFFAPGEGSTLLEPRCLVPFESLTGIKRLGMFGRGPAVAFLHERTSPGGNRRLVRVDTWNTLPVPVRLEYAVIRPATFLEPAKKVSPSLAWPIRLHHVSVTLEFGRPDPADPSHFTIDFVTVEKRRRGVIDAWLNDDDTIRFNVRDPAATQGVTVY